MPVETVRGAVELIARQRRRNPLQEYLNTLPKWDGVQRLEQFFHRYFGVAEDTAYTQAAGKNFLISMVARAYRPGCQVDHLPVLEGPQGNKKTSALRAIGGEWFTEMQESIDSKDFLQNLQGRWLVEISEMDSFNRGQITKVKSIITCTVDRFRPSYGRRAADHPRQCVMAGTTNKSDWNRDETGARRFWPIRCDGDIDLDSLKRDRDQLFAEAVYRYRAGESWWEMPKDETLQEQKKRLNVPAYTDQIQRWLENHPYIEGGETRWTPRNPPLTEVTTARIMEECLKLEPVQFKTEEQRVAAVLKYLNWERKRVRKDGDRPWIWYRKLAESGEKVTAEEEMF
jgi:predicted P-loop ATPase